MAKKAEETGIIKAEDFGLKPETGEQIQKGLKAITDERSELAKQYEVLIKKEINEEVTTQSRALRILIQKNRTQGIEKWHKANKAFWLAGGQFVDALKRKESFENERMETNLQEIEDHFENLEKAKKEKLKSARLLLLEDYPSFDPTFVDLANMDGPTFEKLLKQQEDLKKFNIQEEIRIQKEQDEKKRKAEIEEQRTAETIKLSDFIINYDNIFLSDLPEDEYQTMLAKAKADKQAHDEKQAQIAADNARLAAEKKAVEDKAAKDKADADAKLKAANDLAIKQKAESDAKIKALEKEKADKEAAEKAKKLAEEKAIAEAAKAPDKIKIKTAISNLVIEIPELHSNESAEVFEVILSRFKGFVKWANEETDKL